MGRWVGEKGNFQSQIYESEVSGFSSSPVQRFSVAAGGSDGR